MFALTITAPAPLDAKPWEDWVGFTSMEEGREIISRADVVVIPSRKTVYSRAQLPAKLMDAMMAGKAIIASDLPPIRWAGGDAVLYMKPGSSRSLRHQLDAVRDASVRADMGERARHRAERKFKIDLYVDRFQDAVSSVVGGKRSA